MRKTISVIIPDCNMEAVLAEWLGSAPAHTYVHDGSWDLFREIPVEYVRSRGL